MSSGQCAATRQPAEHSVSVSVGMLTARAAFSHVPFWQSLAEMATLIAARPVPGNPVVAAANRVLSLSLPHSICLPLSLCLSFSETISSWRFARVAVSLEPFLEFPAVIATLIAVLSVVGKPIVAAADQVIAFPAKYIDRQPETFCRRVFSQPRMQTA